MKASNNGSSSRTHGGVSWPSALVAVIFVSAFVMMVGFPVTPSPPQRERPHQQHDSHHDGERDAEARADADAHHRPTHQPRMSPAWNTFASITFQTASASNDMEIAAAPNQFPLVGVCVVGRLNSFWNSREAFMGKGLTALQPNADHRVVVTSVAINEDPNACVESHQCSKACVQSCQERAKNARAGVAELEKVGKVFVNEPVSCKDSLLAADKECVEPTAPVSLTDMLNFMDEEEASRNGLIAKHYGQRRCLRRLLSWESDTKRRFDLIVLLRPDLALEDPLPSADHVRRLRERILLSADAAESTTGGVHGAVAMIPRNFLSSYMAVTEFLFTTTTTHPPAAGFDTISLAEAFRRLNVPHQAYPFYFTAEVLRRAGEPTAAARCAHLRPLGRDNLVRSASDEMLRTPYDDCVLAFSRAS